VSAAPALSEATPVRLGLVLAVVGSLLATVGTAATAHYRLGVQEAYTAKLEAKVDALAEARQLAELRLQRNEDGLVGIKDSLQEIKDSLADLSKKLDAPERRK
jgi:uncharacterized membrane protein